jgi:hypothetical protein
VEKKLAKITHVSFGKGGYDDCMIGLSFIFEGEGWGVGDFIGTWDCSMYKGKDADWLASVKKQHVATVEKVSDLLAQAKVANVSKLKGIPVEVTLDNLKMQSWRILTEVL